MASRRRMRSRARDVPVLRGVGGSRSIHLVRSTSVHRSSPWIRHATLPQVVRDTLGQVCLVGTGARLAWICCGVHASARHGGRVTWRRFVLCRFSHRLRWSRNVHGTSRRRKWGWRRKHVDRWLGVHRRSRCRLRGGDDSGGRFWNLGWQEIHKGGQILRMREWDRFLRGMLRHAPWAVLDNKRVE
jgi:hypothetical protein